MPLALGTAQFGLHYGISNKVGRPGRDEVRAILAYAQAQGITHLDTAQAYGDAETMLGSLQAAHAFSIITKINRYQDDAVQLLEQSTKRLGVTKLYGCLLHSGTDFSSPRMQTAWHGLQRAKDKGLVQKVGVSVYAPNELETVLESAHLDLVQIPANVLDQRFLHSGLIQTLLDRGVSIYIRSLFLQGLLLIPPNQRPVWAQGPQFDYFDRLCAEEKRTPVQVALTILQAFPSMAYAIVGCLSVRELEEIILSNQDCGIIHADLEALNVDDENIILPYRWQ